MKNRLVSYLSTGFRGFSIFDLLSDLRRRCFIVGLVISVPAVILSPDRPITALLAFAGVFFSFMSHETREGGIVTPVPAICWLAFIFGGVPAAILTAVGTIFTGLCSHPENRSKRNLFISHIPVAGVIFAFAGGAGQSSGALLLIPAGFLVQVGTLSLLEGWKPARAGTTGLSWVVNGIASFTLFFFAMEDGFPGALLVTGVMMLFAVHAAATGSRLLSYSGRIGTLSIQNRLMSYLYREDNPYPLFFHDGGKVWTMQGKPAPLIPSPGDVKGSASEGWSAFRVGSSAFMASGEVREMLNSLPERERRETLLLLESVWRASFSRRRLENAFMGAAGMLVKIADRKDSDTHSHSIRVSQTAVKLGKILGLSEEEIFQLKVGALLHDIGKLTIPGGLIMKKGLLTEEERKLIETHPSAGARLLEPMERYDLASSVVLQHHERVDGTGYPNGLIGGQISLQARIVAVADTFDAITSPRAYHLGKPSHIALREIRKYSGTHFDTAVVRALEEMLR